MGWRFAGIFALFLTICGSAAAQTVPLTPAPAEAPVAEEQHPIQVGDVIMAPALEGVEEDRPARAAAKPAAPPRHWYGWPILLGDGVAYGSMALALSADDTAPYAGPLAFGAFALVGPITHAVHGQWGRMGLSVAARASLPFAGLLLGASGCTADGNCVDSVIGGVVAGMVVATIVDAAVLAHEPVAKPPAVQPLLSLSQERLWLGAGGTF